jgi:DNA polymerase III epsilon subunit-like protein
MGNFATAKAVTFLDTELTHLDPKLSALLEVCFITDWDNGTQSIFHTKIKPTQEELECASQEALDIVGYNDEDWANAPSFDQVADKIAACLKWGPLVAHNAQFDIAHLKAIFERNGWNIKPKDYNQKGALYVGYPVIDTCALSYLYLDSDRQNLMVLREHFGLDPEGAHGAKKDCEDCRTVFYNIIGKTLG